MKQNGYPLPLFPFPLSLFPYPLSLFTYYLLLTLLLILGCQEKVEHTETTDTTVKTDILQIYCSEIFATSDLATIAIPEFERQYSAAVELKTYPSETTLIDRLILERNTPKADIAIGIRNMQLYKALDSDLFQPYEVTNLRAVKESNLIYDRRNLLTPIAYSYYAFVYNSEVVLDPPKTLGELQSTIWRDQVLIVNPQNSITGYSIIPWSLAVYSERGFNQFWNSIKPCLMTVAASRTEAYRSFHTGEVPIVLSNLTSAAFFKESEGFDRYNAFIPREGGIREIEYAGIIKNAPNLYLARRFMEFMLSPTFQAHIPTSIWMFPVIDGIELPDSYADCERPTTDLTPKVMERRDFFQNRWIDQWLTLMADKIPTE